MNRSVVVNNSFICIISLLSKFQSGRCSIASSFTRRCCHKVHQLWLDKMWMLARSTSKALSFAWRFVEKDDNGSYRRHGRKDELGKATLSICAISWNLKRFMKTIPKSMVIKCRMLSKSTIANSGRLSDLGESVERNRWCNYVMDKARRVRCCGRNGGFRTERCTLTTNASTTKTGPASLAEVTTTSVASYIRVGSRRMTLTW